MMFKIPNPTLMFTFKQKNANKAYVLVIQYRYTTGCSIVEKLFCSESGIKYCVAGNVE